MSAAAPVRVLVVDDSAVVRRILSAVLDAQPDIVVVGTAADGVAAVDAARQLRPDVITMDVEMPRLDGLGSLRRMRAARLQIPTIMFSTLTSQGARATVEALSLGAADVVEKPSGVADLHAAVERIEQELVPRVRALGTRDVPARGRRSRVRRHHTGPAPSLVCIGISTGGPNALNVVLPALPADLAAPLVIVQHMPPVFTRMLAERLDGLCELRVAEATHGTVPVPGEVWLAPGGRHLAVGHSGAGPVLLLEDGPPEHACRPAVDVMLRTAAASVGSGVLALVMTGLGTDGALGARAVRDAGGEVLAQDRASSVVWGMPGAVVRQGLADEVVGLDDVADGIAARTGRVLGAGRLAACRVSTP